MNETLFGNEVFADVIKLKARCGYEKRGIWTQRHRLTGKTATWRLGCRPKCEIYKPGNREVCKYLLDSTSDKQGLFPRDFGERRALPAA